MRAMRSRAMPPGIGVAVAERLWESQCCIERTSQ